MIRIKGLGGKLSINRIALSSVGEVGDGGGDGMAHKLGTVEGEGGEGVEGGILLGEFERLMALTVRGEVGDVGTGVVSIIAARGGHEPAAVAGEGRIRLGAVRVEIVDADRSGKAVERLAGRILQADGVDVGVMVPDVETAIRCTCEDKVLAVRRETWKCGTHAVGRSGIDELSLTKLMRGRIEREAIEIVTHLVVALHGFLLGISPVGTEADMCRSVIEPAAIRTPRREDLHLLRVGQDVADLVAIEVIEDEVAGRIEHLHLVVMDGVEGLRGLVGRESDERQRWMPGGIDAGREGLGGLEVDLNWLTSIAYDECATPVLAHVEEHIACIIVLVAVTVDALALGLGGETHIIIYIARREVFEATLLDAQLLIADVGWLDETVGDVRIDAIVGHGDGEWSKRDPSVLRVRSVDLDLHLAATRLGEELAPLVGIDQDLLIAAIDIGCAIGCGESRYDLIGAWLDDGEVERCDVAGDGHFGIVGTQVGRTACGGRGGGNLGTA